MLFQNIFNETNHSAFSIIGQSVVIGLFSAITAGITSKIRIRGFTGQGSISQVARQIKTKFYSGQISRITLKTLGKILTYEAAYSVYYRLIGGFRDAFKTNPTKASQVPRMIRIDFYY